MRKLSLKIGLLGLLMLLVSNVWAGVVPTKAPVVGGNEQIITEKQQTVKKDKKQKLSFFQKVSLKVFGKKKLFSSVGMDKTLAIILTVLLPSLVWLWVGLYTDWDKAWWICLLLCFLFILPGWIYGLIKIIKS